MAKRLIEITVPDDKRERIRTMLEPMNISRQSEHSAEHGLTTFTIVTDAEKVETILDTLRSWTSGVEGVFAHVLSVEAVVPSASEEKAKQEEAGEEPATEEKSHARVAREELHDSLEEASTLSPNFLLFTAFSTVVVAIGLVRDSPAIVIGGMVIAPLLGPNMALALATTLADKALAVRALKTNFAGVALAAGIAAVTALFVNPDQSIVEITSRTTIDLSDLLLALAAGAAGALAFTSGAPSSLVGVMVAVALLPPLVVAVLLAVNGRMEEASRAFLLLTSNVVCINLAGVAVFLLKGVAPRTWWGAKQSKKMAVRALCVWIVLLVILAGLIVLSNVAG